MSDIKCEEDSNAPFRICCGKQHWGAVCPNGTVMCCMCFYNVTQDKLHVLPNGMKEDCCQECYNKEHKL